MYNSSARAHAARFIGEQCLVAVRSKEKSSYVAAMPPWMSRDQQTLQQKSSLNTSSVNVAGTSPLTASTISCIALLVSLFKAIPVEHKHLQRFHVRYKRNLIRLPCWRMTHYWVILEKGCTTAGIGSCTLLSFMCSWCWATWEHEWVSASKKE